MKHHWRTCTWLERFVLFGPRRAYTTREMGGGMVITFLDDTSRLSYAEWAKGDEHKYYGFFDPYELPNISK